MFQIIIISKNQEASINDMVNSLDNCFFGIPKIFVLDRPSINDNSETILKELNQEYIINNDGLGFQAGRVRNLGLEHCGIQNTLFFDGDRISKNFNIDIVEKGLELFDVCLGKAEFDMRRIFTNEFTKNNRIGTFHNDCFSCCFSIRKEMIQKIINLQGNLFNETFYERFGEEDRFSLGDLVFHLGGIVGCYPSSSFVTGGFSKITDRNSYETQVKKRIELIQKYNIPITSH